MLHILYSIPYVYIYIYCIYRILYAIYSTVVLWAPSRTPFRNAWQRGSAAPAAAAALLAGGAQGATGAWEPGAIIERSIWMALCNAYTYISLEADSLYQHICILMY